MQQWRQPWRHWWRNEHPHRWLVVDKNATYRREQPQWMLAECVWGRCEDKTSVSRHHARTYIVSATGRLHHGNIAINRRVYYNTSITPISGIYIQEIRTMKGVGLSICPMLFTIPCGWMSFKVKGRGANQKPIFQSVQSCWCIWYNYKTVSKANKSRTLFP